jgi:predicted enzyme related to lactoylglutathione lyase
MFQGLRTVIYPVSDIERAKAWYSALLGQEPYFDQPFYVGYSVGGFELGLDPNGVPAAAPEGGPIAYWGVADIEAAMDRLRELGAVERSPIQDVGDGILVAIVNDPFGNQIGVIRNPHFSLADVR